MIFGETGDSYKVIKALPRHLIAHHVCEIVYLLCLTHVIIVGSSPIKALRLLIDTCDTIRIYSVAANFAGMRNRMCDCSMLWSIGCENKLLLKEDR